MQVILGCISACSIILRNSSRLKTGFRTQSRAEPLFADSSLVYGLALLDDSSLSILTIIQTTHTHSMTSTKLQSSCWLDRTLRTLLLSSARTLQPCHRQLPPRPRHLRSNRKTFQPCP